MAQADNKDGCGNAGLLYTVKDQMQRSPVMAELKLVIERVHTVLCLCPSRV